MAHRGLIRALALLTSLCGTARCSAALQPHATGAGHLQADLAPMQGQQPSRRLLQNAEAITAASGTLVIVSTAQQLAQAVNVDGIQHVLIVSHLNLADLPSMDALDHLALRANASTQSIQARPPFCAAHSETVLNLGCGWIRHASRTVSEDIVVNTGVPCAGQLYGHDAADPRPPP